MIPRIDEVFATHIEFCNIDALIFVKEKEIILQHYFIIFNIPFRRYTNKAIDKYLSKNHELI